MLTHRRTLARTPSRLPTPPPLALDLTHAGRPVGWVHVDAIGFRGFASNVEAAHAAWVAYRAVSRRLAKAGGPWPIPVGTERLTLRRRGDVEVVMASGRPIAKVLLPGPTSRSGDSFGFEIHIPAPRYEARMRGMAYLAYRTLRKSGVRWALWTRDRPPRERRDDAIPATRTTSPRASGTDSRVARPATRRGLALLGVLLLVGLALVGPRVAVLPLGAIVLAALVLVSTLELSRWWRARPATRGRRWRWATLVAGITTASIIGLLLALAVPERFALPLSVLGLTGLLGSRLLASLKGWPATRPIRASRHDAVPLHAPASVLGR